MTNTLQASSFCKQELYQEPPETPPIFILMIQGAAAAAATAEMYSGGYGKVHTMTAPL